MQSNRSDIIYGIIDSYYKTHGGVGTDTIRELQQELKAIHNIDMDGGTMNKRIQEYLSNRFSGR